MIEVKHTWPGFYGASHVTTVTLPDAFRPLERCLRDALLAHARFQRHSTGDVPAALSDYVVYCGGEGRVDRPDVPVAMGKDPAHLDSKLASAVAHLWSHVYGDRPATDDVEPTGYIRRLAAQIDVTHSA